MFETIYNEGDTALQNKYFEFYSYSGTSGTLGRQPNYDANLDNKGDAIVETSEAGNNYTSWFSDSSNFVCTPGPWLLRGGYSNSASNAGVFGFSGNTGGIDPNFSFRPVFILKP